MGLDLKFGEMEKIEEELKFCFKSLSDTQNKIHEKLRIIINDEKALKGNELVGWLGEIYTKIIFNGKLVDDSNEHDVEAVINNKLSKISVKTRKGNRGRWNNSSAIPIIEGDNSPTHLMFVHLNDDYSVSSMWFYPWHVLLRNGRFKEQNVRGKFRSYYMSVKLIEDEKYKIYSKNSV